MDDDLAFSVAGANGFIGSCVVDRLRRGGAEVRELRRDDLADAQHDLGHVIFCIGLTGDFRTRPFDTVDANVGVLRSALERWDFDSFVYLSSARVYQRGQEGGEDALVHSLPTDPEDLYNAAKLLGESLCFSSGRRAVSVARLSNVYGSHRRSETFLDQVLVQALTTGRVRLTSSLESTRDYVSSDDVARAVSLMGRLTPGQIVNVASGVAVTHRELLAKVAESIPIEVEVADDAPLTGLPPIMVERLTSSLGVEPRSLLEDLPLIIEAYRQLDVHP